MPELARFYGIVVRMYAEAFAPHHLPHFHAYYQGAVAIYGIDPLTLLNGALPLTQQRLVEAWAEIHHDELLADWQMLQQGRRPQPIKPLE
jgi:hypothetical protein